MIDPETKIELLPCPFCGEDAAEFTSARELEDCVLFDDERCPAFKFDDHCSCFTICCNVHKGGCGASTGYAWNKMKAAEKWNRRA